MSYSQTHDCTCYQLIIIIFTINVPLEENDENRNLARRQFHDSADSDAGRLEF